MHADRVRLAVLLALYGASPWSHADAGHDVAHAPGAAHGAPVAPPMLVIGRERIDRSGLVSLGDFLQQLPMSGAAVNTKYNGGGDGSTQVDLRDFGSQRTLVLVDGQRFIQGLGGAVDLNAIPLAAVERIEILGGGASAHYGADAIAGVVNVVLRQRFDGAEARAYLGEYEQGDGRTEAYEFTIGDSGERGSVLLDASYVKQEPVYAGDRAISAVPLFGFPANQVTAGASSTTPFGRFGFSTSGNRLPNGAPGTLTLVPGRRGDSAADYRLFDLSGDGHNFVPENYIATPQERTALHATARYALTDAVAFHASALVDERRSEQRFDGFPLTLGTVGNGPTRFSIPASALYNPFGAEVTRAQFRPTVQARRFRQDVDTFRFAAGFAGAFDAWDRHWDWSTGYAYTDVESHGTSTGLFDANRLRAGLGPSFRDAAGVARCGTPGAPIAGCVPLNVFGGPEGFTQEMFDYASFVAQDTQYREQHAYHATLTGALFELPAGPLAVSAGYEYRRESGFDLPDAFVSAGASTGAARPPTRGGFSADDVFVAFTVPLLHELPLAETLAFDIAARRSDYSSFGATTNASYGFRWRPAEQWLVHGRYSQDFRAPSIAESSTGSTPSFQNVVDPCFFPTTPDVELARRCREGFGGVAPVTDRFTIGAQVAAFIGGNPDLRPELGRSRTLGLRYAPAPIPGLAVSLDWYSLELVDEIGVSPAQALVDDCYVRAVVASCAFVVRAPGGALESVFAGPLNLREGLEREGYDLALDYGFETSIGTFVLSSITSYLAYAGELGEPEFGESDDGGTRSGNRAGVSFDRGAQFHRIRSNLTLDWQRGDFGATLGLRYRSALDESCSLPVFLGRPTLCTNPGGSPQFPNGENRLDATTYVDLQARWDAPWRGQVTLGLRNAFDQDPPVSYSVSDGNFQPEHDLPGRFWYLGYRQAF
ncbi:MAG TPA: TonB-dependent receptor [Xanthomonadales bacterium]|nr:TonB-dependent receptor [Xanthomonadales bacterium]